MLRRVFGLWVLLAATGCGPFRAFSIDAVPTEKSSSSSPLASALAPTPLPSSDPMVQQAQATSPRNDRGRLIEPPPEPPMPPVVEPFTDRKTPPLDTVQATPEPPVVVALKYMLDGRHKEAIEQLQGYPPETREVFLGILPVVAHMSEKGVENLDQEDVAVYAKQFESLLAEMRPRAALAISELCFATPSRDMPSTVRCRPITHSWPPAAIGPASSCSSTSA